MRAPSEAAGGIPNVAHLQLWTPAEVGLWLLRSGHGQFAKLFEEHNVGGDILMDVTMDDLQEMGVTKVGDRRRLLNAFKSLGEHAKAREGPQLDLVVLGASPLVRTVPGAVVPLDLIDLAKEHRPLAALVSASTQEGTRALETGTFEALSWAFQLGAMILTLTAHTTLDGHLLLERQTGEAADFNPSMAFTQMLGNRGPCEESGARGGGALPVCALLALTGPGLQKVAQAFLRHGTRHVIAVSRVAEKADVDTTARSFCAAALRLLLSGCTVADAFAAATNIDGTLAAGFATPTGAKFVLLPEDAPGRHDVALFPTPVGSSIQEAFCFSEDSNDEDTWDENNRSIMDLNNWTVGSNDRSAQSSCSRSRAGSCGDILVTNNLQKSLGPESRIVGRQLDIWQVVKALSKSRCVIICGVGGVGKSTLCRCVANYLSYRQRRFCEKGVHIIRLRGIRTVHAAEAQLRHVLDGADATPNTLNRVNSDMDQEELQEMAEGLGERLLILTNAEELLHADAFGFADFLDLLLAFGPRLRVLITSRRALPPEAWPAKSQQLPFHIYLRQLGPTDSAQLLKEKVPKLDQRSAMQIAWLCGHLPLALKLVGQQLAAAQDPVEEARLFVEKTARSPETRASMLFSHCVAPYVWRSLGPEQRSALAALSLFRGAFESTAAAIVLATTPEKAQALLGEFQQQCLVERGAEALYYMPTSVHLLVHQQVTSDQSSSNDAVNNLAAAAERLVFHFCKLLRDAAHATAADRGRGGAGLEALNHFDRHRIDIDLALVVAGTSHVFVLMVQLGCEIFDTRLSPQRRVEIYERLLGILLSARKAPSQATTPALGAGIVQLLRAFERSTPAVDARAGNSSLGRTKSSPARDVLPSTPSARSRQPAGPVLRPAAPRTTPTTPVRCMTAPPGMDDEGARKLLSKSLPTSPRSRRPSFSGSTRPSSPQGSSGNRLQVPPIGEEPHGGASRPSFQGPCRASPPSPSFLPIQPAPADADDQEEEDFEIQWKEEPVRSQQAEAASNKPPAAPSKSAPSRPGKPTRPPPSYHFASSNRDEEEDPTYEDPETSEESDWGGLTALRPAWCSVLTGADNERLRPQLTELLSEPPCPATSSTALPGKEEDGVCSVNSATAARWGFSRWWHQQPEHDIVLIEVLLRLGAAHSALGRFAHAAQLLRKALIKAEEMAQRTGDCAGLSAEAMRAELLGTLSGVLCQQGLVQEAEAMLWQARQLAKYAGHAEIYVRLTCDLAEFNRRYKGNLKAAQRLFAMGLDMRIKTAGLENIDTASTLNAVGMFYAQQGDFEEAKKLITDALRIRAKLLGKHHLSMAEAYHSLATVHEGLRNYADAVKLYELAIQVKRNALPEGHSSIADTASRLGRLYGRLQRHSDSLKLLQDRLAQCIRSVGEMHQSTASALEELGRAQLGLASQSRNRVALSEYLLQLQEAQANLERALAIRRAVARKRCPKLAACRGVLGKVHFHKLSLIHI